MADDDHPEPYDSRPSRQKNRTSGIIQLPPGSRGPKSLYIKRNGDSFGFTLRHFIVYPPDAASETDTRHAAVGALSTPMDTIFVKNVKDNSPAKQAGLKCGDRLVGVNRVAVTDKSYPQVVQLIQNSPEFLHLLVVPKEDDILQRYFSDTAHNPVSNQQHAPNDNQDAQQFISHTLNQQPREFQVDSASWRSLRNSYGYDYGPSQGLDQRYADGQFSRDMNHRKNIGYREKHGHVYSNDSTFRSKNKAQPQAPLHKKMGRRASDGYALSDLDSFYNSPEVASIGSDSDHRGFMRDPEVNNFSNSRYPPKTSLNSVLSNTMDSTRRNSSSYTSSLADGSKGSLISFDSSSTLTGHETDNSSIMSRYRKSFQQKEEFLKMPSVKNDSSAIQREFYSRPKKMDRTMWPPNEPASEEASPRVANSKQNHHTSEKDSNVEDKTAVRQLPKTFDSKQSQKPSHESQDEGDIESEDEEMQPVSLYTVFKRAKQFESGKPLPEDDLLISNRMSFYKSELARLSSKRVVPNVTELTQEFETRSVEPKGASNNSKMAPRDSKSMESTESNVSSTTVSELSSSKSRSGNVVIASGSKYLHCPPPSEKATYAEFLENNTVGVRSRSNSSESWLDREKSREKSSRKVLRQNAATNDVTLSDLGVGDVSPSSLDPTPLIPESVEHIYSPLSNTNSSVSCVSSWSPVDVRSRQLSWEKPSRSFSKESEPPVVKRRIKSEDIEDDERTNRRQSYLKATEGGEIPFYYKLNDTEVSSQALRSGSDSGLENSYISLEKDKKPSSVFANFDKHTVYLEGPLHCKITELDTKRFGDRSWKQIYAVLRGARLLLCKDKQHQNPVGVYESADDLLYNGIDMRTSVVRIAEDYTKRKNVLRVHAEKPCEIEFLLQADTPEELAVWLRTLQGQLPTAPDGKADSKVSTQQAVPQTTPASTTLQVQGTINLSPQLNKPKTSYRSPVSYGLNSREIATSPKSTNWRAYVTRKLKKIHGASYVNSPTAPEGSTFGLPLDQCIPSLTNPYVPRFIEVCTDIMDSRGLNMKGIYRVPGNNASITALTEEINKNYETVPLDDDRWNDVFLVSSLLKSYFRKMPECLLTSALYPVFIKVDKISDPKLRLRQLKKLIESLPPHNYHTLKHVAFHLKRVNEHSEKNGMDAKNLAIVFAPTIIRSEENSMEHMVNNMNSQCSIVESLVVHADWFFSESDTEDLPESAAIPEAYDGSDSPNNQALLLENINRYEALKDREKNGALFSSIISAAQRKVRRKTTKGAGLFSNREGLTSEGDVENHASGPTSLDEDANKFGVIPTTVTEIERLKKQPEKVPCFNYSTDGEDIKRRVKNFEQETYSMLQMPRNLEISVNTIVPKSPTALSSSPTHSQLPTELTQSPLNKRNSTANVAATAADTSSHSKDNSYSVQYMKRNSSDTTSDFSVNIKEYSNRGPAKISEHKDDIDSNFSSRKSERQSLRKGTSVENLKTNALDLNANGVMEKMKCDNGMETSQRTASLDSLNKIVSADDDTDLVTSLTKLYDKKMMEEKHSQASLLSVEDLTCSDESREDQFQSPSARSGGNEPKRPVLKDLYRNPSLHKNIHSSSKLFDWSDDDDYGENSEEFSSFKEDGDAKIISNDIPDSEIRISITKRLTGISDNTNKLGVNSFSIGTQLKRSESLNKPEKSVSPHNIKLNRSESLNKTGDKVKRCDSLTKNEKTESNLNKRRETSGLRRPKEQIKSKRKNCTTDRSIKRRHTVGGTKDPDKVTWLDNKYHNEVSSNKENREVRTSSPDLSSTRRERLLFEINLIGSEDMTITFRPHLIGSRPQSFPESSVFPLPLESHV